ncbi:MAG TPA: ASCH domain-containing protein [Nitrososphaeraceae archaeon]|nr:ASCH domain-containing protein [Nitrososphaeraceae archaeon]
MKCLSLKQPFADLLALGEKTIELRKWNTKFRGKFLVHASKNIDIEACERLDIDIDKLTKGAIIGSAFLYDVKELGLTQLALANKQDAIDMSVLHYELSLSSLHTS